MNIKITDNFDISAAKMIAGEAEKARVMALPTGNTPLGLYRELKKMRLDWSRITIFMLDINYPQDPAEPTSFYSFAKNNLPKVEFNILNSQTDDPDKECQSYEAKIQASGGLGLAVLGIGENGHIAYNEPGTSFNSLTHLSELSPETVRINRLKIHQGLTMGIKTIMSANKIILLAKGENKAGVIRQAIKGPVTETCPASILQNHPDVIFILDREAASLLK